MLIIFKSLVSFVNIKTKVEILNNSIIVSYSIETNVFVHVSI